MRIDIPPYALAIAVLFSIILYLLRKGFLAAKQWVEGFREWLLTLASEIETIRHIVQEINVNRRPFAANRPEPSSSQVVTVPGPSIVEPIVAAIKENTEELRAMRLMLAAVMEAQKRLLSAVFASPGGGESVSDDEMIMRAQDLVREHPGLKIEDAMTRLRQREVYRP